MTTDPNVDATFSNTDVIKIHAVTTMALVSVLDISGTVSKADFASILSNEVKGYEDQSWAKILMILIDIMDNNSNASPTDRAKLKVVEGGMGRRVQ